MNARPTWSRRARQHGTVSCTRGQVQVASASGSAGSCARANLHPPGRCRRGVWLRLADRLSVDRVADGAGVLGDPGVSPAGAGTVEARAVRVEAALALEGVHRCTRARPHEC